MCWRLFVGFCVCQHNNFQMSKHTMMKLGVRCIVQKSRPSSSFGVIASALGCASQKNVALGYDVGKIGAGCLVRLSLRPGRGAEYCDQFVCVSVFVCEHISGTAGPILHKILCADALWPWLGPLLVAL